MGGGAFRGWYGVGCGGVGSGWLLLGLILWLAGEALNGDENSYNLSGNFRFGVSGPESVTEGSN